MNTFRFKIWGLIIGLMGLQADAWAQESFYVKYDTEDVLPSAEVYDLAIDEQGLLWATTDRGVCSYDGYQFTTYETKDGLSNNTNFEIIEDDKGRFWFTGFDGSMSFYEDGKMRPCKSNDELKSAVRGKWVSEIELVDQHLIFSPDKHQWDNYFDLNLETQELSSIDLTEQDFHSENKLGKNYLIKWANHFFYNDCLGYSPTIAVKTNNREALLAHPSGELLLITDENVSKVELLKEVDSGFFYKDRVGHVWIGTSNGLVQLSNGNLDLSPKTFFEGLYITSVVMDQEGNYWVASLDQGIFFLPSINIQSFPYSKFFSPRERILSIGSTENHIIFGSSYGKVVVLDEELELIDTAVSGDLKQVQNIYSTGKQAYTIGHVVKENGEMEKYYFEFESYVSFLEMKTGLYFMKSSPGYDIYNEEFDRIFNGSLSGNLLRRSKITAFVEDENQMIWIGTLNGLYRLDPEDYENPIKHNDINGLSNTRIEDIHNFKNGRFWLATLGNGLLYVNKDTTIQITSNEGLDSDLVNGIALQGDSIVWVASNKGLNKVQYQLVNKLPVINSITSYNTSEGLLMNFINDIEYWKGKLWLAFNNGINYFDPAVLKKPTKPALIYLDSVNVLNSDESVLPNANIEGSQNNIVFHFTGVLHNKSKTKPFYKYKLTGGGLADEWYYTNERQAQYVNLEPGDYQFTFTARNNSDIWANPIDPFTFTIKPYYYETVWFRVLAFLSIAGLIGYFIYTRNREVEKDKKLQEALFKNKDAELSVLRNQMNPHFIFNSLNSIQNYIFKNDIERANYYMSRFSRLMRNSLEFSKLEYISLAAEEEFINTYMELEKLRFPDQFDFEFDVEEGLPMENYFIPPLLLQPVLENAVKYAFKHADYKGLIQVKISEHLPGKLLKVIIQDNGSGIDYSKQKETDPDQKEHRSLGLKIIKDRIQLLKEDKSISGVSFKNGNLPDGKGFITEFILPIQLNVYD